MLLGPPSGQTESIDLMALDNALNKLEGLQPEQAKVVELRLFRWPDDRGNGRGPGYLDFQRQSATGDRRGPGYIFNSTRHPRHEGYGGGGQRCRTIAWKSGRWRCSASALIIPIEQQQAWLAERCDGRPALLERVQRLLRADEDSTGFMESGPEFVLRANRVGERLGCLRIGQ